MPKARTYTDVGYVEVQWSKNGRLICLVSATVKEGEHGEVVTTNVMHQLTERGHVGALLRDITRARKQSFGTSASRDAINDFLERIPVQQSRTL